MKTIKHLLLGLLICVLIIEAGALANILGGKLFGYTPRFDAYVFGMVIAIVWFYSYRLVQQYESAPDDSSHVSPSHDEASMHVYVFDLDDNGAIVGDIWTHGAPDNDEKVILWDKEHGFRRYKVAYRIYGGNLEDRTGAWNVYVKQSNPEQA